MVPGGKYFYVGDPGLTIYDLNTLEPAMQKDFRGVDLLELTFSSDGEMFAVVSGGRIYIDQNLQQWDPKTSSIVRIHETLTGKTLFAFAAPTRWIKNMRFSPDGSRLALAGNDGMISVWMIPSR